MFSFTIPAIKSSHYHDVSQLPFLVTESVIFLINGDIYVTYSGTINDVLGALWWTRVQEIDFVDSNGIDVNVLFNPDMNIVTIDTIAGSEMIVMTPTNPGIWPLAD